MFQNPAVPEETADKPNAIFAGQSGADLRLYAWQAQATPADGPLSTPDEQLLIAYWQSECQ